MSILQHKVDFVMLFGVTNANPNGDPLTGNRPRTDYNGYGETSDVCIKRKIRNRMQDMGKRIYHQMAGREDDGYKSLNDRIAPLLREEKDPEMVKKKACERWLDVRSFGQVFSISKEKEGESGSSISVCGPVSVGLAVSASPVDVRTMQITKSANNKTSDKRGSDTMGQKHFVRFGLYMVKGAINVQEAELTGFTEEDAETIKECLRTLFVNDASSARPDGSMEVVKVFWWDHNSKMGQHSAAKVHNSVKVSLKPGVDFPSSVDDYDITVTPLPGLEPEIIEGF